MTPLDHARQHLKTAKSSRLALLEKDVDKKETL